MWDTVCGRDWLEINAVNSTLFIFMIATAAKVFATLSGQIHSFHFQLLLPPFLCWTGKYAGARNLGLSKSSVGQAGGPTNTHSFTVLISQTLMIQLWCLKVIELGLDEPAFVQSPNLFAWFSIDTYFPLCHNRVWVDIVNYYVEPLSCLIIRYAMSAPLQFWILSYRNYPCALFHTQCLYASVQPHGLSA